MNLSELNGIESSKLIYAFSKLKVQDRKTWNILENLFLMKEKQMNLHDFIMCTWAFSKMTKNQAVWQKIEDAINHNIFQFKEQ